MDDDQRTCGIDLATRQPRVSGVCEQPQAAESEGAADRGGGESAARGEGQGADLVVHEGFVPGQTQVCGGGRSGESAGVFTGIERTETRADDIGGEVRPVAGGGGVGEDVGTHVGGGKAGEPRAPRHVWRGSQDIGHPRPGKGRTETGAAQHGRDTAVAGLSLDRVEAKHRGAAACHERDDIPAAAVVELVEVLDRVRGTTDEPELPSRHREVLEDAAEAVVDHGSSVVEREAAGATDDVLGEGGVRRAGVGDDAAIDIQVTDRSAGATGESEGAGTDFGGVERAQDGVIVPEEAAVEGGIRIVQAEGQGAGGAGVVGDVARA